MPSFLMGYQGEDISFNLEFEKGENLNINSFRDFSEIVAYMYTDGCYVAKFSTTDKSGYGKLNLVDDNTLSGILTSESTKLMSHGTLFVEINAEYQGSTNMINKKPTGIVITKNFIKSESK